MPIKSNFDSSYSVNTKKLSREIQEEIRHYRSLTDINIFNGALSILQKLRLWEAEQLRKHGVTALSSETPEWKGILNQIQYARKLVSENLDVTVKTVLSRWAVQRFRRCSGKTRWSSKAVAGIQPVYSARIQ